MWQALLSVFRFLFGSSSLSLNYAAICHDLFLAAFYCISGRHLAECATSSQSLPGDRAAAVCDDSLISVVIPAFNEGSAIAEAIEVALRDPSVEVVVADGGSTDDTAGIAERAGARVVQAPSGRAACQNAGAAVARGELLLFLHGDTRLPAGYGACVRSALRSPDCSIAAFSLRLSPRLPGIKWVEWGANRRSRRQQLPYGDQALSMRREVCRASCHAGARRMLGSHCATLPSPSSPPYPIPSYDPPYTPSTTPVPPIHPHGTAPHRSTSLTPPHSTPSHPFPGV